MRTLPAAAKGDGEGSGLSTFTLREDELWYPVGEMVLMVTSLRKCSVGFGGVSHIEQKSGSGVYRVDTPTRMWFCCGITEWFCWEWTLKFILSSCPAMDREVFH